MLNYYLRHLFHSSLSNNPPQKSYLIANQNNTEESKALSPVSV